MFNQGRHVAASASVWRSASFWASF